MTADTEAMTAVRALLDERQRYEGWIRGLDAHRETAAPHVYERVRGDYAKRLSSVLDRLAEHAEQLRSTVDVLTTRQQQLQEREADRQEARQEAELRAAVGEYSEEEWSGLRDDADLEIALIVEEREGVEKELGELQRIMQLTSAAPEPTAAVSEVSEAETDAQGDAEQESVSTSSAASPAPAAGRMSHGRTPVLAAKPGEVDDEQSIEDFVADWPVQHVADTAATAHATSATPQAPSSGSQDGRNVAGNGFPQGNVFAHVRGPAETTRQQGASSTAAPLFAPPLDANASSEPTTEIRREQEKTLKCPECGALNYATEWYCERCGGELATY
jgi:hypothetical protein